MTSGIYRIFHRPSGKFYVGSSNDIRSRFMGHRRNLRAGTHHCKHLQRAWEKHGEGTFVFEILEEIERDRMKLWAAEQSYFDQYGGSGLLYNTLLIARLTSWDHGYSEAGKEKQRLRMKGCAFRKGQTDTIETRELKRQASLRISQTVSGRKQLLGMSRKAHGNLDTVAKMTAKFVEFSRSAEGRSARRDIATSLHKEGKLGSAEDLTKRSQVFWGNKEKSRDAREVGRLRMIEINAKRTPEERSAQGRKAALAGIEKRRNNK